MGDVRRRPRKPGGESSFWLNYSGTLPRIEISGDCSRFPRTHNTLPSQAVPMQHSDSLLVVDDEKLIADTLYRGLTMHGYQCDKAYDGATALQKLQEDDYSLLICDVLMPGVNGLDLLTTVKQCHPGVAVVMMTAVADPDVIVTAMKRGALDYVLKPYSLDKVLVSVGAALEKQHSEIDARDYQENILAEVRRGTESLKQKTEEMRKLLVNIIQSLAVTLEAKDKHTEGHSRKVALYAGMIARELGLSTDDQVQIESAGLLHDIGKIATKESVLSKPGRLTNDEYTHIKEHPLVSEKILQPIKQFSSMIPHVKHHHERFDGSGYPDGLSGNEIPLGARVLCVADAYDAITSGRVYREKRPSSEAFEEMQNMAGRQFDPEIVRTFSEAIQNESWRN